MTIDRNELRALLIRLDIPDCRCQFRPVLCACEDYCSAGYYARVPDPDGMILELRMGPVCKCPHPEKWPPPCKHILAKDHRLSCAEWAAFLEAVEPDEYEDPPAPAAVTSLMTREDRVEVLARRRAMGVGLWHPEDWMPEQSDWDDQLRTTWQSGNNRSFSDELIPVQRANRERQENQRQKREARFISG